MIGGGGKRGGGLNSSVKSCENFINSGVGCIHRHAQESFHVKIEKKWKVTTLQ